MNAGFVLMLSTNVPPDPIREEVPALLAQFKECGVTYVLTTKNISAKGYTQGVSRVALIVNGSRKLVAHGVFQAVHDYRTNTLRGPKLYHHLRPPTAKLWVELSEFVAVNPPQDIAVLGWFKPGDRTPLTSETIPKGQGGQYFKVCHP